MYRFSLAKYRMAAYTETARASTVQPSGLTCSEAVTCVRSCQLLTGYMCAFERETEAPATGLHRSALHERQRLFFVLVTCREPFVRKCAFDVGDYGLGFCTFPLSLGCDCLGHIHYFDAVLNNTKVSCPTSFTICYIHAFLQLFAGLVTRRRSFLPRKFLTWVQL